MKTIFKYVILTFTATSLIYAGFALGRMTAEPVEIIEPEPIIVIQSEPMLKKAVVTKPEPVPVQVDVEPELTYDEHELEMLACVIYQEAGGDKCCDDCRRRVADVVLNRVVDERFPNTIEEVLTAKQQYGRFYWTGVVWPERASQPGEAHAVERAYRIAEEVLTGEHSALYGEGYIWQAEFEQGKDIVECCKIYFGR